MFTQSHQRTASAMQPVRFDGVVFHPATGRVEFDGGGATLRPRTAATFEYLLRERGRLIGKDELLLAVWTDAVVTEDSLTQCIKEIRRALEPGHAHLIRTVPRLGYQFTAPLDDDVPAAPVAPAEPAKPVEAVPGAPWHERLSIWAGGGLTLVMLLGIVGWAVLRPAPPPNARPPLSIVVLPFVDSPDAPGWLAEALTGDLTLHLGRTAGAQVISADTARSFRDRPSDPRDVARELGVRYVVRGAVQRQDDRVQLDLVLIDGATGTQRWVQALAVERPQLAASLADLAQQLARSLSLEMHRWSGEHAARLAPGQALADDVAMQGWAVYFRGLTPENLRVSATLFEAAARQDPASVRAWGGIAVASGMAAFTHWASDRPAAITRLHEALEQLQGIDADGFHAHVGRSLAALLANDWEAVLAINTAGVARFPSHSPSHYARAIALTRLGRFEDCFEPAQRALRLGPRDHQAGAYQLQIAQCHFMLGQDREATAAARLAMQASPRLDLPPLLLAAALARSGDLAGAQRTLADFRARRPTFGVAQAQRLLQGAAPRFVEGRERWMAELRALGMH